MKLKEKDYVKEDDEIEEKDYVKEDDEIEEKDYVKDDEDEDADMTDAVPATEHKDFYASISLTENFTEEVVGVEDSTEEKETVPDESDAVVPDMDHTLEDSRNVDEQIECHEEPEDQQCNKLVDFETEPDAPVATAADGTDADVCDTHADEIEDDLVFKYIPETTDTLPSDAEQAVEEEGCVVESSSNHAEAEEFTEQKQDLHDEVKPVDEEITPAEQEEEIQVEQKEEKEKTLPPAANTSPLLTESDSKEVETTSPIHTSPPQQTSPRKTSPHKTSPHKTLQDRSSVPHESSHPENHGCATSSQPRHETADAQPEVVDRLPEQGSVKALLAQWREIERQKLAKQNLEETSVIDFCDDGEDFHRRDNRSRSCGPHVPSTRGRTAPVAERRRRKPPGRGRRRANWPEHDPGWSPAPADRTRRPLQVPAVTHESHHGEVRTSRYGGQHDSLPSQEAGK